MEPEHTSEEEFSPARTWGIITGIAALFLVWGLLIFFAIGDKGPPDWDFSTVPDVPGESPYSTSAPYGSEGRVPGPYPAKVDPQHVQGPTSKTQQMEVPK